MQPPFRALMTAIYPAPDLARAKAWYATAFGVEPYFDEPFYVGFSVGGYELGLVPSEGELHQPGNRGVIAYWGVASAAEAWTRMLALGATALSPVQEVGGDIRVAVVADPFGNALGLIENPHFRPGA
jgi:predicted enzyme related to lactoylglutathione lyase